MIKKADDHEDNQKFFGGAGGDFTKKPPARRRQGKISFVVPGDFEIDEAFFIERLQRIAAEKEIVGDVVIKLGDKEESRALNLKYLQKDYPTDVLSFPFSEELPGGYYLGDIFICFPLAKEQARENGISLEEELFTLMVHGLLHLWGLDHETDAGEMAQLQEQLVEKHLKKE